MPLIDTNPDEVIKRVKQLARKPLRELRRRQVLVVKQIGRAFQLRADDALANLQQMERELAAAVDFRVFGGK